MTKIYRTRDGDVLDDICYQIYGTEKAIYVVLDANPKLTSNVVFKAGIEIILPEFLDNEVEEDENALWT